MRSHYSAADFYDYDPRTDIDPLCCCEFFDRNNERAHLLVTCCCCCCCFTGTSGIETPTPATSKLTGSRVGNMLLTFQDRLRIPWRGGAKQITLDNVVTLAILIGTLLLTAVHFYLCLVIMLLLPLVLLYLKRLFGTIHPKTKFFTIWFFGSCVYLVALFELAVPLLEILPQENVGFVVLMTLAFLCLLKAKQRAVLNHLSALPADMNGVESGKGSKEQIVLFSDRDDSDDGATDSDSGRLACQLCRKYVPPRTYHCKVCSSCVLRQDHHNVWLNCCIGKSNHRLYLAGCLFTLLALLVFANLALTAVCHPTPIFTLYGIIVMMPDDCTDIFFQYDIALCFTGSVYALIMASFIAIAIVKQICFISFGLSFSEWRRREHVKRRNCLWNWKAFCFGQ
ncbi:palmitoyltransferase ZDHHC23-B isoform X1 [Anopheles arabiensis]|uniref:Palmitoyltransferase n=4 Tax=gambiae species complex TaxID=44542 RepID=A0A9I3AWD8_ANOCL|nr:palmitoyltransferase ZDHHC23-B isoform X1 [Anopheles arabiensis]XP_040231466.1 palmitoyltransferase ZDHHC23-B isoform X1 [Anopheles coluzzii]